KLNVPINRFEKISKNLFVKYYGLTDRRGFSVFMFLLLWRDIKKTDIVYHVSVFSPSTPLTIFLSFLYHKKLILSPRGQLSDWSLNQGSIFKKAWLSFFIKPV